MKQSLSLNIKNNYKSLHSSLQSCKYKLGFYSKNDNHNQTNDNTKVQTNLNEIDANKINHFEHKSNNINQDNTSTESSHKSPPSHYIINPYQTINLTNKEIDYNKLIQQFGSQKITQQQIGKIQQLTQQPAHHFLTRDIFFSHRGLDEILDKYEKGKPFYLYTGRGPSTEAMHLGHLMPFIFTRYLQRAFDVSLVIQITDDEKYFHHGKYDIAEYTKFGLENIKDIIACGFDENKTFIFLDSQYIGHMYQNVVRVQKNLNFTKLKGVFGIQESDNCGMLAYPAIQAAPCLSSSFPHIFGSNKINNVQPLIPQGIDQDPYFLMFRGIISQMKADKPACIHSKFFPGIKGFGTKMSSSDSDSAIFLTDSPASIKNKINKFGFSGGGATLEAHRQQGANLEVDIPFTYLKFFMPDDCQLKQIEEDYGSGKMTTGEVKAICIDVLQKVIKNHQDRRKEISDAEVKKYMEIRQIDYIPTRIKQKDNQTHDKQ